MNLIIKIYKLIIINLQSCYCKLYIKKYYYNNSLLVLKHYKILKN